MNTDLEEVVLDQEVVVRTDILEVVLRTVVAEDNLVEEDIRNQQGVADKLDLVVYSQDLDWKVENQVDTVVGRADLLQVVQQM